MSTMSSVERTRAGRRPGESGTREAIADAARRRFAELGYDRTTIRGIAEEAGVDAALVVHFFGSKQELFLKVMELPFEPEEILPQVLEGPKSEAGLRVARFAVGMIENRDSRDVLTGILRAAASEPHAAELARELVANRVVAAFARSLAVDQPELRGNLIASQVVGLIMARYVIRVEPLASLDPQALVEAIAPNLQRYLTRPL
jgi:AcrR family transcriptional regulator